MELYPGKHLFADDFMIESLEGARRALNKPEKVTVDAPLPIALDKPWEQGQPQFNRVVYDEQHHTFRLYYNTWVGNERVTCALDSGDGLHWQRPDLGLVEFNGSKHNNIINCPPGDYLSIIWDPHEREEAYRWKRVDNKPSGTGSDGQPIWRAFHSQDGYNWLPYPGGPHSAQKMLFNFGSPPETFGGTINPDANYVLYSQRGSSRRTRALGRRDSMDFLNWSGLRTVIDQDLEDPPGTEFYTASTDVANRTEGGLHLMLLHIFQTDITEPYAISESDRYWGAERGPAATPARIDGFVHGQLAVSRDTASWKRYREPFITRGQPGAWDWGTVYPDTPIRHNGKLWFYYNGLDMTHNGRSPRLYERPYGAGRRWGKGLAHLRPDGYVSVEAVSYAPAILTTHRFRQEAGGTVRVNVDAAVGELRYEVLEDTGQPIPGFTVADCDPIRADTLDGMLSWHGAAHWPGVDAAKRERFPNLQQEEFYIKLRFYISPGAKLYSLTLDPPEVTMWRAKIKGRVD
ncbi:MAG: hypothetical protein EXR62_07585 [Chloroflexi bacterium]|nr:hypothetical protein [Chloroflexota bacterium]